MKAPLHVALLTYYFVLRNRRKPKKTTLHSFFFHNFYWKQTNILQKRLRPTDHSINHSINKEHMAPPAEDHRTARCHGRPLYTYLPEQTTGHICPRIKCSHDINTTLNEVWQEFLWSPGANSRLQVFQIYGINRSSAGASLRFRC